MCLLCYLVMLCLMLCASNTQAANVQLGSTSTKTTSDIAVPVALIEYEVIFEQISPKQHAEIRAFYTQYSGYSQHAIVSQNTETTVVTYKSEASIDLLVNNFSKTTEYLGMHVLVRGVNNTISIRLVQLDSKSLPYKEW